MELILFFILAAIVSVGSFWVTGLIYGLFHRPSIYFPLPLATKMAICAVFGALLFGVGGVILATLVFNAEMAKRQDYSKWSAIVSGIVMSVLCSVVIYFAVFSLAWKVLD